MRTLLLLGALLIAGACSPAGAQMTEAPRPGLEHTPLHLLDGAWTISLAGDEVGTATGRLRLGGLFVELELDLEDAPFSHAVYTLGYDQRNGLYTVTAMDDSGSYAIHASGEADEDGRLVMYGIDDDPTFREMGLEKAFAIVVTPGAEEASLEIRYVDTRTEARNEMSFATFEFRR